MAGTTKHYADVSYDGAGNVDLDFDRNAYTWDILGMMTGATVDGRVFRYVYDAKNERIVAVERVPVGAELRNRTTFTLRGASNQLLSTWTDDWTSGSRVFTRKEDTIWRGSQLLCTGLWLEHHALRARSPRITTLDNELHWAVLDRQDFDPFGAGGLYGSGGLQFCGHERDQANLGAGSFNLPDYFHARFYDRNGRFLSPVDPVLGQATRPQSWNRYAYASNNPVNVIDPSGLYITTCSALDIACKMQAAEFEGARGQALQSTSADTRAAAAAYGEPDDDNGVLVTFDDAPGNPADTTTTSAWSMDAVVGPPDHNGNRYMGYKSPSPLWGATVTFHGPDGITPENVAHEGSHVSNALRFFRSWNGTSFDDSLRVTRYATENAGYHITASFVRPGMTLTVGQNHVFTHGMSAAQRQAVVDAILRDPAMGYRITPTSQGGLWP